MIWFFALILLIITGAALLLLIVPLIYGLILVVIDKMKRKKCEYSQVFPDKKKHCMYYSKLTIGDKIWWTHFPKCSCDNCPIKHPELLDEHKRR